MRYAMSLNSNRDMSYVYFQKGDDRMKIARVEERAGQRETRRNKMTEDLKIHGVGW